MKFKNINTAINQELGRIAGVQHHAWGIKNPTGQRSVFDKPLEFNDWLLKGMNRAYEKFGTEFETVCPGLMRIKMKNGKTLLRTLEDFQREHKEYVENYYL
ncbi:MAG: hypothetical protein PHC31_07280 [Clostridia bacterium]|nr:hypothetical protein [Clostridia bacterium]MDD3067971.1 hypothetical protein [Acholeplasmataceae bacterium]MDD3971701.1 hypothetical protein [Clostridia bacterium]